MPQTQFHTPARSLRLLLALLPWLAGNLLHAAGDPSAAPSANLAAFDTPATAHAASLADLAALAPGKMGYLGVRTEVGSDHRLVITAVAPDSPAAKAGVLSNDVIRQIEGQMVATPEALRKLIEGMPPGKTVKLSLMRAGEPGELTAQLESLATVGRDMERVRLGIHTSSFRSEAGVKIETVETNSRAATAGLMAGDLILKIGGRNIDASTSVADALADRGPESKVRITILRYAQEKEITVQLAPTDSPDRPVDNPRRGGYQIRGGAGGRGFGGRTPREVVHLAVVGIEFPDVKHNPMIGTNDWAREFFSTNIYTNLNATGQATHGSINDYFLEQSAGATRIQGRVFDWVEVSSNRMEYSVSPPPPPGRGPGNRGGGRAFVNDYAHDGVLLTEALDKLVAREGRDALLGYDGVIFLYAGQRAARDDTNTYWPHSTGMNYENRRLRYVVAPEGGYRMADISVLCHEIGHVLGLPDLYVRQPPTPPRSLTNMVGVSITGANPPPARNPNPYAQSLALWDLMAVQTPNGRPQHLSAWSKEQLGWLKPTLIDPTIPQRLVLGPVEKSSNQCFKIPLRPDGSEYLLLENRRPIGFDASLPAAGLLIWRVVYGRPILEEAHGLDIPNAASRDTRNIPYPTARNDAFTPFSRPSSAALTGDELPVYITDVQRQPDGRITFLVGNGFD